MKLKWHLFWSKYHHKMSQYDFEDGNYIGAMLHLEAYARHAHKYVELGGDEEDVYGETD